LLITSMRFIEQIGALRGARYDVQHAFREEREVGFVGAGLASAVSDVSERRGADLLRRAAPPPGLGRS